MLMCTLLVVNPFNLLIKSSLSADNDNNLASDGGPSRTLMSQGTSLLWLHYFDLKLGFFNLGDASE